MKKYKGGDRRWSTKLWQDYLPDSTWFSFFSSWRREAILISIVDYSDSKRTEQLALSLTASQEALDDLPSSL